MPEKNPSAKAPRDKSVGAEKKSGSTADKAAAAAVVSIRGTCTAQNCQRALRAKGYCRKHFLAWRRGKLGQHHQYKICTKEACRKKREFGSLCAEHAGKGGTTSESSAAGASS